MMISQNLRFWLKEATIFPIDNENLAINYLTEFYGGNIIGYNFIKEKISQNCINNLLDQGRFILEKNGCYSYHR